MCVSLSPYPGGRRGEACLAAKSVCGLARLSALSGDFVIPFMLIAGGLALLLYYRIALKKSKEQTAGQQKRS